MNRTLLSCVALLLLVSPLSAADLAVDLRYEPTTGVLLSQALLSTAKMLKPARILPFTDKRSGGGTYLGELKVDGQKQRVLSKTAIAAFATAAFRQIYSEWGGRTSQDSPLLLIGEITQFALEEADGYQARVGFHFYLTEEGSNKVLWDGHSSGIVRGSGRALTVESLSGLFSDILRDTYIEMLEDEKLVGVWSGRVSNTFFIKEPATSAATLSRSGS